MAERIRRMRQRNGSAAAWATANPILKAGEIGVVLNGTAPATFKIGDGLTAWSALAFQGGGGGGAEIDPVFTASAAAGITGGLITNWNTAYSWGDHSTAGYALVTYVDNAINTLINGSPALLDTLNELAAALGNDPNFATTVTNALANKENTITAGTTTQYWRGDKSWQTLDTTAVAEVGNLYFTTTRVRSTVLTGFDASPYGAGDVVLATDTLLVGLSKLQGQINAVSGSGVYQLLSEKDATSGYVGLTADWRIHFLDKNGAFQSLLANDNTGIRTYVFQDRDGTILDSTDLSDINTAIATKEDAITAGTTAQYWRGDKTWQTLNTTVVPEGTNLYYTSARFNTAFSGKSTTDLAEGSNLYYTAARFNTAFAAKNTTDLSEGTNLYYTAARFNTAFAAKSTTDLTEGTNLYYTDVRADARITLQKGAANGLAPLDGSSKIPTSYLPALAITDTFVVASQVAMLALTAQTGDVAVRTDLNKSFILAGTNPAVLADWQELLTPASAVISVNGFTGAVSLSTDDIPEGSKLYYSSSLFDTDFAAKKTDDLPEGAVNFYYTDARFDAAFTAKTTDDLNEGGTNLYYATSRFNIDFAAQNTDGLTEGSTNLYYTAGRFNTAFAAKSTTNLTEGTNLYYTDARARAAIIGTTNRITVTTGVVDISASYVGQTSITTLGTITAGTWTGTRIAIANGGTGQTTANAAFNALAPSQTGNSGKFLRTDGTDTSWVTVTAAPAGSSGNLQWNNSSAFAGVSGSTVDSLGNITLAPTAATSGSLAQFTITGAGHTTLASATEASDVIFNLARTVQFATGALTTQRAFRVMAPTYAFVGASTLTNAATFAISGAPIAGTNATLTNTYAIWVQGGASRFDGLVQMYDTSLVANAATPTKTMGYDLSGATASTKTTLAFAQTGNITITFPTATGTLSTLAGTETLTNKRINSRVVATTQSATPAINSDNGDIFEIVGLAQAITSMTTNLTGTPVEGQMIEIIFKDNGTARAITWGASFTSSTITLPTTTVLSTPLRVLLQWQTNSVWSITDVWVCIAVA